MGLLPWAQEAPGSNPGAPTTKSLIFQTFVFPSCFDLLPNWEQLRSFEQQFRVGENC